MAAGRLERNGSWELRIPLSDVCVSDGCLDDEECRMSLSDVWMTRNPGWMGGFLSRGSMWSSSGLLFFFCKGRLCSFCRANISDVRCPASSCYITIMGVMNTKGKMFCITTVEFLMKIVKKCCLRRGFDSQHNLLILVASCSAVFCRVVLRFFPIVLSSVESRIALLRCTVRESWFPSCSSLFVCSAESCSSPCRL